MSTRRPRARSHDCDLMKAEARTPRQLQPQRLDGVAPSIVGLGLARGRIANVHLFHVSTEALSVWQYLHHKIVFDRL